MIWFTSDTHYAHSNICYSTSKWPDKENSTRKFDSIEQMNRTIVENINKYVQQNDTLYFLGDWCMDGIQNIYNFWKQINCKNIYFIPGNHDQHIKSNKILPNCKWGHHYIGFEDWYPTKEELIMEDTPVGAEELFNILPELTTIIIDKQKIILSHYPLEEWEDMSKGVIHLHGHCHGKINSCETNTKYKRMDVGLDWKEFRPYSLDEILEIMKKRENKKHIS